MRATLVRAGIGVAGLMVGLAVAPVWARTPAAAAPLSSAASAAAESAVPRTEPIDAAQLREIVRAELARSSSATAPAPQACPAAPAAAEPEPEVPVDPEAWASASEVLADAIDEGEWSDAQALAFRARLSRLPAAQSQRLIAQLVTAINEGRLDLSGLSTPL